MDTAYFHKISENQFLNSSIELSKLNKLDILFKEGDSIDYIYFLIEGELNVIKGKQVMWQAHENEFIGISSFFNNDSNYAYTVKTCQKTKVLLIPLDDFKKALINSSTLNNMLMHLFCERIKLTHAKIKSYSNLSKRKRLINLLINKAKNISNSEKIILEYTSIDLAEFVNIPHKFVKATLLELQNKKLVKLRKEAIEILDFQGLKLVLQMKII